MNKTKLVPVYVLVGALAALGGCSSKDNTEYPPPAASQGSEATPPELTASRLTDGQILQVIASVDSAEIKQGQLALTRATDARVREYAQHMIDQHTQAKQKGSQLASANEILPVQSPLANKLETKTAQIQTTLESTKPAAFDTTYMTAQITEHKEVLEVLDSELIPAAKNPAMGEHLSKMRNLVQMHLSEAQLIAPSLTAAAD
jgi:putative membrane protein